MPTCWICLKELSEQEFAGDEDHNCQATTLGEPGPDIPSSDCEPPELASSPFASAQRAAPLELELTQGPPSAIPSSSSSRASALDIIRRGTIRRGQTIARSLEPRGIFDPRRALHSRLRQRRHASSTNSIRGRSLPAIPEEKCDPTPEATPPGRSTRPLPIPPLTPWRRLLLIQDYTDREEELSTVVNRLDDAIASSPELWTSGFPEGIDGRPVSPVQFYRRLHEFHQQRIANNAPSSVPFFFPRLGAKQYEW